MPQGGSNYFPNYIFTLYGMVSKMLFLVSVVRLAYSYSQEIISLIRTRGIAASYTLISIYRENRANNKG